MSAQLIVQSTSDLDGDYTREIPDGITIREVIDQVGAEFRYNNNMVASINNVQQHDHSRTIQQGDTLMFRVAAKERG